MNIVLWGLIIGVPLAIGGALAVFSKDLALRAFERFAASRRGAWFLTAIAWLWTAYECHIIGIDVFDMILKIFPGELWILATVLTYLTIIWMPNNLATRALMGLFMLLPAELFKTTRLLLPQSGVATVHILVVLGYILAIIGMYGMFYPWRIEKVLKKILGKGAARIAYGAVCLIAGIAAITAGFVLA